jgi:hypothetical protein
MNRLLVVVLLLAVGVVALGIYQGWFTFSSNNSDDKANVNIKIDKDKMREDEKKAVNELQDLGHKAKDKAKTAAGEIKDKANPPGQPPQ